MLSATSFQLTLLSGQNSQNSLQLYVLGGVFLAASAVWYPLFRLKPSVYVLSLPWIFFGLAFFLIGLPSVGKALNPAHTALSNAATWCYAVASAAGFLFFGLNFGEEAVRFLKKGPLLRLYFLQSNFRAQLLRLGLSELALYKDPNKSGSLLCGIGVGL